MAILNAELKILRNLTRQQIRVGRNCPLFVIIISILTKGFIQSN